MNRREAIRKTLGLGAAAASLPVLHAKLQAHNQQMTGGAYASLSCAPVEMKPPPPDMRTPEQVFEDQDAESLADIMRHLTREPDPWSKRYAYSVWPREFDAAWAEAQRQGLSATMRQVNGFDAIIGPNGNIVRKLVQQIYFAKV